jgi:ABC-type Fe3+ transport system substrate-binding protein
MNWKNMFLVSTVLALIFLGSTIYLLIAPAAGPKPGVTTVTQTVTQTSGKPQPWPYEGKVWVPILNKYMSYEEVVAEIKKEGSITIADWTYWGLVDTYFIPSFKSYVKNKYGVDVEVKFVGTQEAKGGFMYQLYSAYQAGLPAPYDAMHIEINFFEEAKAKDVAEPFLPSPLVPNLAFVDPVFIFAPYGVQFQQHAMVTPVFNLEKTGFVKSWLDLADPRLKGKITLWSLSDNGFWAFLATVATALGYDYKNPEQMNKAIEWVAKNIHPNVLKYTSDEAEIIELSEKNVTWITAYWCCSYEMEQAAGNKWLGPKLLEPFMPNLPGVVWIPKKAQHPVLAQIYVDWLLSKEFQFPDINSPGFKELNPTEAKKLWAGMIEGPLGPYYEQFIPDWWGGKENFYKVFPTLDQYKKYIYPSMQILDWEYINAHAEEWVSYYQKLIGG